MEIIPPLLFLGPCWILAGFYYYFGIRKHLQSQKFMTLNSNLEKAGLFWSTTTNEVKELTEGGVALDREKSIRSFLIFTAVLSIFSFMGMILLALIFMTSRSRLEYQLLDSRIATDPQLSAADVAQVLAEVKLLV